MSKNQEIAETILQQLGGGRRLVMMVGAYNFVVVENGVAFKIKNAKANYIKIKLNSKDLYDLEVGRIRGTTYKVVAKKDDLYFDMLKPAIEEATGMYLSLFKKGGKMKEPTIIRGFSDDEPYEYAKGGMMKEDGYSSKKELNDDFKRIIQAPKTKNFYETKNDSYVGKLVTVKLPNEIKSFKTKVLNEYFDMVSTKKGIFSKKYIIKMAKGGMMANGGLLNEFNYSIGGL